MTNNFVFLKNSFLFSAAGFGTDTTAGAAITAAQFSVGKIASDARQMFIYNNISIAIPFDS